MGGDFNLPDLAGWRRETMPEWPGSAYCTVSPGWTFGVVSPSTRRIDQNERRAIAFREGASHPRSMDPDAKTPGAFDLEDGRSVLPTALADSAATSRWHGRGHRGASALRRNRQWRKLRKSGIRSPGADWHALRADPGNNGKAVDCLNLDD